MGCGPKLLTIKIHHYFVMENF